LRRAVAGAGGRVRRAGGAADPRALPAPAWPARGGVGVTPAWRRLILLPSERRGVRTACIRAHRFLNRRGRAERPVPRLPRRHFGAAAAPCRGSWGGAARAPWTGPGR